MTQKGHFPRPGETDPYGLLSLAQFTLSSLYTRLSLLRPIKVDLFNTRKSQVVATETGLPAATLGHLALAEKQYLGLTFLQVLLMLMLVNMVTIAFT